MMNSGKTASLLAIGMLLAALSACQKTEVVEKGPAERAGAQLDNAVTKAAAELNKAAEQASIELNKVAEQAGKSLEKSGEQLQGAAKDAQKKE